MKKIIFIVLVFVCHLVIFVYGQNCPFAQRALTSSQRMDWARSLYLDELRPQDLDLYVTEGHPGFEVWAEADVAQPFWDDFRRARILLAATEAINHKMFFDRECNDLTPYTNCFTRLDVCYDTTGLRCDPNLRYRTMGGTCNNLVNPKLGAQFSAYSRLMAPDYHDCLHSERRTAIDSIELPSPRIIGNILAENGFGIQQAAPTVSVLNVFGAFCGQLITHDTGSRINVQRYNFSGPGIQCCSQYYTRRLSEEISHPACKPIDIPVNDPFYSQFKANCLNFVSSQTTFSNDCKVGPAQQSNSVSAFMDLTIVYGDDQATQNRLRSRQSGRMITNAANVLPETPNCRQQPCYFLGDVRLNQTPMLAQWHSLFLRLHNLIAPLISANDEIAYQEGKRLTTALYQRIVFNEWLPIILGQAESINKQLTCDPSKANCGKYNQYVDPSNTNEFTHGAFRWLHAFVPSTINLYGPDKRLIMSRALSDMNSSQVNILNGNYDNLLRGVLNDPVNYGGYSPELRNRLMKDARGMGIDLFSIDIKRARDHGVPPYHTFISTCTNTPAQINNWPDLDPYFTPASLKILQTIYKSPRDIDLLVGVLGERRLTPYTILGKIGSCIIAEQFKRFKFGDRFFYQWTDGPYPFTQPQLQEIERFTMAKFLCSVSNIGSVPQNAFLTPSATNPIVACTSIPKFNFALFAK
ncbi:Peroxidase [Pseudolycoriella hygida]|uniref:Peroxidase n=1 Tax=Pseudolycoriella hygida TaxID=35572 RepID=A0A9Q0RVA9_9DIPT|nr:Peroxidase [Pseudolycoriella hygida]